MPNYGRISFELLKDFGKDSIVIQRLLNQIIQGIAKRSVEYYHNTKKMDHVFLNSEGELHTTVTPAISNLTNTFKTEFPANREYSKTGRRGHVDYWIFYKNIVFLLELKLAHKGFARGDCTTSERIFDRFNEAIFQLESIYDDKLLSFIDGTKKIIKIGFETIVFGSKSPKIRVSFYNNPKKYHEMIENSLESLVKYKRHKNRSELKLKKSVDFKSLWLLNLDLTLIKKGRMPLDHIFPAVGFIGHIENI